MCPDDIGIAQSQEALNEAKSGCRSEVTMHRKLLLCLGILVPLVASGYAQNPVAVKVGTGFDPLGILEDEGGRSSGVKSSVVIKTASIERIAFDLINAKRAESGLQPLTWSDDLAEVARVHSQNMAEFSFFSHRGLDNKLVSDRADDVGMGKWRSIGENIAFSRGYKDPVAKAVELWLDSPAHHRNLLDSNWNESAVGIAIADDGSFYFTQVFLVRK